MAQLSRRLKATLGIMEATHSEIVDFRAEYQDECGLSVDWSETDKLC